MIWKIISCIYLYFFKLCFQYSDANSISINLTSYRFWSHPYTDPTPNLPLPQIMLWLTDWGFYSIFPNNHYRKLYSTQRILCVKIQNTSNSKKWKSRATEESTMANWYPIGERWTTLTVPCRCWRLKRLKRCARKKI